MTDEKTFDDLLEELATTVKETLGRKNKIAAHWARTGIWTKQYHIYWNYGWLRNQALKDYILIIEPQFDDSKNVKNVCINVYTPKILDIIKQTFEKYKGCYERIDLITRFR